MERTGSNGAREGGRKAKNKARTDKKKKKDLKKKEPFVPHRSTISPCTASSTTAVDAATTCHAPRSASAASCPGSHPAYPDSSLNELAAAPPEETSELAEGSPPA